MDAAGVEAMPARKRRTTKRKPCICNPQISIPRSRCGSANYCIACNSLAKKLVCNMLILSLCTSYVTATFIFLHSEDKTPGGPGLERNSLGRLWPPAVAAVREGKVDKHTLLELCAWLSGGVMDDMWFLARRPLIPDFVRRSGVIIQDMFRDSCLSEDIVDGFLGLLFPEGLRVGGVLVGDVDMAKCPVERRALSGTRVVRGLLAKYPAARAASRVILPIKSKAHWYYLRYEEGRVEIVDANFQQARVAEYKHHGWYLAILVASLMRETGRQTPRIQLEWTSHAPLTDGAGRCQDDGVFTCSWIADECARQPLETIECVTTAKQLLAASLISGRNHISKIAQLLRHTINRTCPHMQGDIYCWSRTLSIAEGQFSCCFSYRDFMFSNDVL
jgi:hypothetical protein